VFLGQVLDFADRARWLQDVQAVVSLVAALLQLIGLAAIGFQMLDAWRSSRTGFGASQQAAFTMEDPTLRDELMHLMEAPAMGVLITHEEEPLLSALLIDLELPDVDAAVHSLPAPGVPPTAAVDLVDVEADIGIDLGDLFAPETDGRLGIAHQANAEMLRDLQSALDAGHGTGLL